MDRIPILEALTPTGSPRRCPLPTKHPTHKKKAPGRRRRPLSSNHAHTVGYSPSHSTLRNFMGSVLPSVENSSTWLNRSSPMA